MKQEETLRKEFLRLLGQRIKALRLERGLSQAEVANICGKERQSYQRIELGKVNPTIWYLQHIASALKVELKDLVDLRFDELKLM